MKHTRTTRPARRSGYAFSLLELIAVVVIVAVMVAIAVPRYAGSAARYRAQRAAGRVAADLALARRRAKTTGSPQTVSFSIANNRYTLPGAQDFKRASQTYTVVLGDAPYQATLLTASFGGNATVIFDGFGSADTGGTVTLKVGSETRTITLDAATGTASVQ